MIAGREPADAYRDVGGKAKNAGYAAQLKTNRPLIRRRLEELMDVGARKAMLSRSMILQRIYEDWELSRKLGQMGAAATNAKLMGSELHRMFIDRKEIGGPGDFDQKTPEELLEWIKVELAELGDDAKDITNKLGINLDDNQAGGITLISPPQKKSA